MLHLVTVTRTFAGPAGRVTALDAVSLGVRPGEFVAVQGPSGSGKTTLLLIAGALLAPESGTVRLAGQDPYDLAPEARAALRARAVGFVFQQFHLVPYLSVLDNVLMPSLARRLPGARERAERLIEHVGLADRRLHVPAKLSTGERQRVALARALLGEPGLVLADEPTGNLDRESAEIVLQHLADFAHAGGAVLMVTHDDAAAAFAGRRVRLRRGRLET